MTTNNTPTWAIGDTARVVAPGPAATTAAPQLVRIVDISGESVIVEAIEGRYEGSRWATGTYKLTAAPDEAPAQQAATAAPASLPRRARASRVEDAIDRHHGVDLDKARRTAATLGTAGLAALSSADEDGYLTAGHPASLASLARAELVEQAEHPALGRGPRTYRITRLGRTVVRLAASGDTAKTPAQTPRKHRMPVRAAGTPQGRRYTASCRDCDYKVGPYSIRAITEDLAGLHRAHTARA